MKILHIVGGSAKGGAFKGVEILHNALLKLDIDSNILNDTPIEKDNLKGTLKGTQKGT